MIIHSFVRSEMGLKPVKVEVVLTPGLSQIQILGMADTVIKESSKRILSALRHQGFRIPPGKQVLVNLHPNYVRKKSQGLDLAIAIGILLESEQVSQDFFNFKKDYCYGGLSLKGDVIVPEDLSLLNYEIFEKSVLTGISSQPFRFTNAQCESLSQLSQLKERDGESHLFECQPLLFNKEMLFEKSMARLMAFIAHGEHPLLIAGAAGCGKTTLVEHLATLLPAPSKETFLQAKKIWGLMGRDLKTRPVVAPHHSITPMAMIGGGAHLQPGEISLAHSGALVLDELLEFHPQIQSALREPMEKGVIYLSRAGRRQVFPAQSLFLGTTNLCGCGRFKPGATSRCRCSSLRLRQYIERLSGPFLDRFAVFHIYDRPRISETMALADIQEWVQKARNFQEKIRKQSLPNQHLSGPQMIGTLKPGFSADFLPHSRSHRRRLSLLRVARSLADLDCSPHILQEHLEEAQMWTARDIYRLERFSQDDFAAR